MSFAARTRFGLAVLVFSLGTLPAPGLPMPLFFPDVTHTLLAQTPVTSALFQGECPPAPLPFGGLTLFHAPWLNLPPPPALGDWRQALGVVRLGVFTVPLRDDTAERANILRAAEAVDGVTVAPGAVFSFNRTVGERTPERGFEEGWMYDQGRLVRGTGGGICLVSTGLYNATLRAGLELIERHPHSGLVGYAPPGCDAAVVYGVEDMQFRNTTPRAIQIKTRRDPDRIVVQLYGAPPPPDSRVEVATTHLDPIPPTTVQKPDPTLPPGQTVAVQTPRAGFHVVVARRWLQKGRVVREEVVTDERRPARPGIVRVGPATEPSPGDPSVPSLAGLFTPAPANSVPANLEGRRTDDLAEPAP